MRLFFRACCVAAVANLFLTVGAAPADEKLPRDPNNFYGRFENGFSYIIREHKNPPDRVAFFLHVDTGALNETDSQNGLAHFLEHMAFNGSKNFEPGDPLQEQTVDALRGGFECAHES